MFYYIINHLLNYNLNMNKMLQCNSYHLVMLFDLKLWILMVILYNIKNIYDFKFYIFISLSNQQYVFIDQQQVIPYQDSNGFHIQHIKNLYLVFTRVFIRVYILFFFFFK